MQYITFFLIIIITSFIIIISFITLKIFRNNKRLMKLNLNINNQLSSLIIENNRLKTKTDELLKKLISTEENAVATKDELALYKHRTEELEDTIGHDHGIQIRTIVNETKIEFNKFELIIMQSGIFKLLKEAKNFQDMQHYVKLGIKIQEIIDKLPEPSDKEYETMLKGIN